MEEKAKFLKAVIYTVDGKEVGSAVLDAKRFSTGSVGFFGVAKLTTDDGKKYQSQFQMVEIGSKPDSEKKKKKEA